MKNLKLLAALLALAIGLAGCGNGSSTPSSKPEKMLDGDNMIASNTQKQEYEEPEDVTYMRLLAGEDEYRACVLYLGGSYEVTTDVQQVLDTRPTCGSCGALSTTSRRITGSWHRTAGAICTASSRRTRILLSSSTRRP